MIRAILAFAILAIAVSIASAQQLPDDSGKYHLIVVTSEFPMTADETLVANTETHPQLSAIRARCKSFVFKVNDPLYQSRYASALGITSLPKVALVRSDGGVLYKASGPATYDPDKLAADLMAAARADRAQNPRPADGRNATADCPTCPYQPQPQPSRTPIFRPGERPSLIPDTVNVNTEVAIPQSVYLGAAVIGTILIGGMALVAIAGLGVGITILVKSFS